MDDASFIVLAIVFGVVFGFACSAIAKSKNRDPAGYFVLGLLLGIFGLIITACMPKVETQTTSPHSRQPAYQRPNPYAASLSGMRYCPQCDYLVSLSSEFCPNCGVVLNRNQAITPGIHEDNKKCPYCAEMIKAEAVKCKHCGSDLVDAPPVNLDVTSGTITHDIMTGDQLAFSMGEQVQIESVSPDPDRPEYQYVVLSKSLNKRFRLSDRDVSVS
jgi:RNA polymerase subunit RPABC4/transcription elongation factor Spt4